jgi:hypothetical protein
MDHPATGVAIAVGGAAMLAVVLILLPYLMN